jgi:hypothetical protein
VIERTNALGPPVRVPVQCCGQWLVDCTCWIAAVEAAAARPDGPVLVAAAHGFRSEIEEP